MPIENWGKLRVFRFSSLDVAGLKHAVYTRHGGVSRGHLRSLNVGGSVGDDPQHVAANRIRSLEAFGTSTEAMVNVWQIHSDRVLVVDQPLNGHEPERADAMVTNVRGLTLMMRFADCVPIFTYDPVERVIGMAHAGWQGTLKDMAGRLVQSMVDAFGCAPANIIAGLGPSIAAHHYPVGPDVAHAFERLFREAGGRLLTGDPENPNLDLWHANGLQLEAAGVQKIELSGICTACQVGDWYSHRGEHGRTGRFAALMALES
jgi:purine-nucleoside/S-methyl-5'-thioadenosine phosphorylase / adenosine deaminase